MTHTVVVDLGYGDAGKGRVVDLLCAESDVTAVVRFNGGAQAAHNVVLEDGRHHTFAQFGSGTFRGVRTHLSRFVVVDPLALAAEAAHLAAVGVPDPFGLLTVEEGALLATPWHRAANRAREQRRGTERHGSCGLGVGETVAYALAYPGDAPRVGDVRDPARLRQRLVAVRDRLTASVGPLPAPAVDDVLNVFAAFRDAVRIVDAAHLDRLLRAGPCVFEGAQGVLLDEWFGWHPHTTWSTTTFANAAALLGEAPARRLGVVRTYTTRHGAGPHVTADPALDVLPELHNGTGEWQGAFRRGHFDAVAHRYAVEVCGGVDALAVTHLDAPALAPSLGICTSYRDLDRIPVGRRGDLAGQERLTTALNRTTAGEVHRPTDWPGTIGDLLGAPVVLATDAPTGRAAAVAPATK
ncbi:adenylosuccinate synthetase [Cryptosporangium aurantiacum]|uniref:Adenylosuccinate synthetase n=1 Tax=Cryptosporangium aurantiacum TaxID=134849 RepID=A0A1M7KU06_9ACTN|nr:adenylosuccinate synthetase [Cryptosporangium aurantiacum]SHM69030.1 adenylosuccinate synthase [Cryptosporangium aurantiacum]